jgi:hypothetical protein
MVNFQTADLGIQRGFTDHKNKGIRPFNGFVDFRQPVRAGRNILPVNSGFELIFF